MSLILLVTVWMAGLYVPLDLLRHPLGFGIIKMPKDVKVISCYTTSESPDDERSAFYGGSGFGAFWQRRRGLDFYHGQNVGPRNADLELTVRTKSTDRAGYLIYEDGGQTNAIVYFHDGHWTSGAILGQLVKYSTNEQGFWKLVRESVDTSDCCMEDIYRYFVRIIAIVLGIIAVVLWNIREIRTRRRQHAAAGYASQARQS